MIFSELYSAYYNTVAQILTKILDGQTDEKELREIVADYAFGESASTVLPNLKSGKWQLTAPDMTTPLLRKPTMPLTLIQKRWLKAIAADPRIRLFDAEFPSLEGIEPLFTAQDYRFYDQYADGDPFGDADYIAHFRFLLQAVKQKQTVRITMLNKQGREIYLKGVAKRLEYSLKDDKFRLLIEDCHFMKTVNLAKIISCATYHGHLPLQPFRRESKEEILVLKIYDERKALERVMLHFSHFEKQAERCGQREYLMRIRYRVEDETELVIRVLSFGHLVEVLEPSHFVDLIKERLRKQYNLFRS